MYIILSLLSGAILTLAFAPVNFIVAGLFAFTSILLICDKFSDNPKKVFWLGFAFGFGHHLTGVYWISNSLLVEADKFAWMIPFAASLIPAYLAIYSGLAFWITYKLKYKKLAKFLFLGSLWVFLEIVRTYAFTGFPWNLLGYTMLKSLAISQVASVTGVFGLSLIAIYLFASPYLVIRSVLDFTKNHRFYRVGFSFLYLMPIILALILISIWGEKRIVKNAGQFENTTIRIVQPSIAQKEKFDPLRIGDHIFKYVSLSVKESEHLDFVPDIIVWPEAATPFLLDRETEFVSSLQDVVPYTSNLILGSVRRNGDKIYNSIQVIDHQGSLVEDKYYDKHHLVPFGEYVPLREFLPAGFDRITHGRGDFNTGSGPQTLTIAEKPPFSPTICYEIIFPDNVINRKSEKQPEWILNLTNDAWFGITSGPHQHLQKARMRAIEEGKPVIRAANTGISAVIDAYGFVINRLELEESGIIDSKLPKEYQNMTYFSKQGLKTPIIICALLILIAAFLKFYYRTS